MERIILEYDHVTGNEGKFRLKDISFSLPAGYMMGLIGANGAGKTTCFQYLMQEKKRYSGTIRIDGVEHYAHGIAFRNQIGFVSEDNVFFEDRTGTQNVDFMSGFYEHFDRDVFGTAMEKMKVSAAKTYGKMSRGERLKFQMAFAMAHRPRLYLLDEVTAGMDPVFRIDFFKILHEAIENQEASILMTSHIESEIKKQMDYIGIIENGSLTYFGENKESLWVELPEEAVYG